jgi:hypothetical protein
MQDSSPEIEAMLDGADKGIDLRDELIDLLPRYDMACCGPLPLRPKALPMALYQIEPRTYGPIPGNV